MSSKGQSTIEYLLLVTAVIVVIISFLRPGGPFQGYVQQSLTDSVNQINSMADAINVVP